jgi:hypothetical protein
MFNFQDWVYNGENTGASVETLIQIRNAQEYTFNTALELNFNAWKAAIKRCVRDIKEMSDKRDFIKNEFQIIENEITQNRKAYGQSLLSKSFDNITGTDFQRVKILSEKGKLNTCELNIPESDKLNFRMHLAKKQLEYLKSMELQEGLTHRQHAIILFFKVLGKHEKLPTRTELRNQFGKNREVAFFNIYQDQRPLKSNEIESILPFLQDFPNALKLAQDKLKQLE